MTTNNKRDKAHALHLRLLLHINANRAYRARQDAGASDYSVQALVRSLVIMGDERREALLYDDPRVRWRRDLATFWEDHEHVDPEWSTDDTLGPDL